MAGEAPLKTSTLQPYLRVSVTDTNTHSVPSHLKPFPLICKLLYNLHLFADRLNGKLLKLQINKKGRRVKGFVRFINVL